MNGGQDGGENCRSSHGFYTEIWEGDSHHHPVPVPTMPWDGLGEVKMTGKNNNIPSHKLFKFSWQFAIKHQIYSIHSDFKESGTTS